MRAHKKILKKIKSFLFVACFYATNTPFGGMVESQHKSRPNPKSLKITPIKTKEVSFSAAQKPKI